MNDIEKRIIEIFWKSLEDGSDLPESIVPEKDDELDVCTELTEWGMDSIAFIRMIVMLEEEFDVIFPDESMLLDELNTVQKIEAVLLELTV